MNNVCPRLTMMTEEQIQESHRNVLQVLSETGVRVDFAWAQDCAGSPPEVSRS